MKKTSSQNIKELKRLDQHPEDLASTKRDDTSSPVTTSASDAVSPDKTKKTSYEKWVIGMIAVVLLVLIGIYIEDQRKPSTCVITLLGGVKLEMVKVEHGSFTMSKADGDNEKDEKSHEVTLTQDFYIGKYEVTLEQWDAVMISTPSYFKLNKHPVESVNWHDAMEFCEKLNKSGKAPAGYYFTLPTETQWEYASKGGKKSKGYKYSGSNTVGEVAWYYDNAEYETHPVGTKKSNELGLYDMSGNVFEWCLDDYTYDSREAEAEFIRGNDSSLTLRVLRGGGFNCYASYCRAADRYRNDPLYASYDFGFRIALVPEKYSNAEEKQTPSKQSAKVQLETRKTETETKNIQTIKLTSTISLELMKVEAGSFTMSANDGENNICELPHTATLTQDYYIGKYEVTQEQWESVMGSNPSHFKGNKLPVDSVIWYDAIAFCEKLNKSGKAPAGYHFTLPTETQWEYAAKGGKKSKGYKYSGSNTVEEVAWYDENSGYETHEVGTKKANELGLYDMSGNVSEMCLDDYMVDSREVKAEFTRGRDVDPTFRVIRGGNWYCGAGCSRVVCRDCTARWYESAHYGFRVALVPAQN